MYVKVPVNVLAILMLCSSFLAMPKSDILIDPHRERRIFDGLMSLCICFEAWTPATKDVFTNLERC